MRAQQSSSYVFAIVLWTAPEISLANGISEVAEANQRTVHTEYLPGLGDARTFYWRQLFVLAGILADHAYLREHPMVSTRRLDVDLAKQVLTVPGQLQGV